jgi:hypothetical protein
VRPVWIELDGQRWLFDEEQYTLADYFVLKAATGLGRAAFLTGVLDEDPAALQALIWFLRRKDEPDLALEAVNFRPAALDFAAVEEPDVDPPAVPEAASVRATSETSETSTSTS